MRRLKTLVAKNPSEARGIRKALRAAGIKYEFKTAKLNPSRRRKTKRKSNSDYSPTVREYGVYVNGKLFSYLHTKAEAKKRAASARASLRREGSTGSVQVKKLS